MKKFATALAAVSVSLLTLQSNAAENFVSFEPGSSGLAIVQDGRPLDIVIDNAENDAVSIAAKTLAGDFYRVCGDSARIVSSASGKCIIVGSLNSALIKPLLKSGKITRKDLEGKKEKYILTVVDNPQKGVDKALVIAGSDRRGTVYGIYELSRQMGVSPWYWWMDVPVDHREFVSVADGVYTDGEPKVEYRGIFLNDEAPSLSNWTKEKFGGYNSTFYAHVFELVLRLKGNFMWPAMWNNAFYDDDKENGALANKMGIVMSTSHHEPMNLAQQDWKRRGNGEWDFTKNKDGLSDFWRSGIERSKDYETVVTIGMRGDGDMAMGGDFNIALMEDIVSTQREIIRSVTGKDASETPQVWALYKEVQDYYDKGMKVPDDVTLLLCDDNWGNVRRLPALDAKPRKGGYGMYYHFDYVGAPRNSKWINISPIPRVWEQMNITYAHGVDKIWIVNVGDLKPMEYPITFFLDMAWNPERFNASNLKDHSVEFCKSVFGERYAEEAARILRTYAKYNRRVTPEKLDARTFTHNYDEWRIVRDEYKQLAADALNLGFMMPAKYKDAFDELIAYPVLACSNLYEMYYAHSMNTQLARKNDPEANHWADEVERCFKRDGELTDYYHNIAGGKWNHMMDQIHIGYTSWNHPKEAKCPEVKRINIDKPVSNHFTEIDGCISMEAEHYTRSTGSDKAEWTVIPELGRTLSGLTTMPCTAPTDGMALEYDMDVKTPGLLKVTVRFAPTLNYNVTGHSYAISFDGEEEQIVNINGDYDGSLGNIQSEHLIAKRTKHQVETAGKHTLRIRPLTPGLVFQKILVNTGGMKKSFLGAPETIL